MEPKFEIAVDPELGLVRSRLSGFFDHAAFERYCAAQPTVFRDLRCSPDQRLALTDIREMSIQSQEILTYWSQLFARPENRSARLAFVVTSPMLRRQLQRALAETEARIFADPAEAEAWLLSGEPV